MSKQTKPDRPALDADAQHVWDSLVAALGKRYSDEDALALELFCTSFVALRQALEGYRAAPTVTLHNGVVTVSPFVKAITVLRREVDEGIRRFGLAPAARVRLNVSQLTEQQRLEEEAFAREFD